MMSLSVWLAHDGSWEKAVREPVCLSRDGGHVSLQSPPQAVGCPPPAHLRRPLPQSAAWGGGRVSWGSVGTMVDSTSEAT